MTTSLYWKPVTTETNNLPDEIMYALRKRYGTGVSTRLNRHSLEYLKGLTDAGVLGALELADAIEMHGEIELFEQ